MIPLAKYWISLEVSDELLEKVHAIDGDILPAWAEKAFASYLNKPKFNSIDHKLKTVSVDY